MITLNKSQVVFDEAAHEYHLGDAHLSGITSLIHNVLGLGNYPEATEIVKNFYIPRAGERGTSIHHAIQSYDQLGIKVTLHPKSPRFQENPDDKYWDVSRELDNYIINRHGYEPIANEYTVSDNVRYASQIDNVWRKVDTGGIWLYDTKSNNIKLFPGGLDALKLYLSWQLSCYAYMFERQNPHLKVEGLGCNLLREDFSQRLEIERIPDEDVAALLATPWVMVDGKIIFDVAAYEGSHPKAVQPKPAEALIVPQEVVDRIYEFMRQQKEAEAKVTELKAVLRTAMEATSVKSWDCGKFKATIAADSTSTTFDSKRFKAEHPDLYKQYTKQTAKKGGFTITLREDEAKQ